MGLSASLLRSHHTQQLWECGLVTLVPKAPRYLHSVGHQVLFRRLQRALCFKFSTCCLVAVYPGLGIPSNGNSSPAIHNLTASSNPLRQNTELMLPQCYFGLLARFVGCTEDTPAPRIAQRVESLPIRFYFPNTVRDRLVASVLNDPY